MGRAGRVPPHGDYYAAAARDAAMLEKIWVTLCPAAVTAATATRAINATSNAYSNRSCPSSAQTNLRNRVTRFMCFSQLLLRRFAECRRDAREDRVHALAGRGHGRNGDERDERDEKRVLEQVLSLIVADERAQAIHEIHDGPPGACLRAMPCVRNATTLRCAA